MLNNHNLLIIGARAGGYGEGIAKAAVMAGARVFGTTLNPGDVREQEFFKSINTELLDIPVKFDVNNRARSIALLNKACDQLRSKGVDRLHSVVHAVAGGFPRHPSVMKAVGDILRGQDTFRDLATSVKQNVYYVNATSYEDTIKGLESLTDSETVFTALTYRGELPYFISPTKEYLERLAVRWAKHGKSTLIAAFPEAWTQSSQFFTGIDLAVLHNYMSDLMGKSPVDPALNTPFGEINKSLSQLDGFQQLLTEIGPFLTEKWRNLSKSPLDKMSPQVQSLYADLRNKNLFSVLRKSVEYISEYVRRASGVILINELLEKRKFNSGDVRQVFYADLIGGTEIGLAAPRPEKKTRFKPKNWLCFGRDEIAKTLPMYGANFLFLDRVVMESGDVYDGFQGYGSYTVPTPEENPILKDHFIGMPLFGGHLQMEAAAQFAAFIMLRTIKNPRLLPILTGTEFPDINTMAPPGETLKFWGIIRLREKRRLILEAVIENRYARSKGIIKGIILSDRVLRKMMSSFCEDSDLDENSET